MHDRQRGADQQGAEHEPRLAQPTDGSPLRGEGGRDLAHAARSLGSSTAFIRSASRVSPM